LPDIKQQGATIQLHVLNKQVTFNVVTSLYFNPQNPTILDCSCQVHIAKSFW